MASSFLVFLFLRARQNATTRLPVSATITALHWETATRKSRDFEFRAGNCLVCSMQRTSWKHTRNSNSARQRVEVAGAATAPSLVQWFKVEKREQKFALHSRFWKVAVRNLFFNLRTVKSSQRAAGKIYQFYSPSQERATRILFQEGCFCLDEKSVLLWAYSIL